MYQNLVFHRLLKFLVSLIVVACLLAISFTFVKSVAAQNDVITIAEEWVKNTQNDGRFQWMVLRDATDIPNGRGRVSNPSLDLDFVSKPHVISNVVELFTWTSDHGMIVKWNLTVKEEKVVIVQAVVEDILVGDVQNVRTEGFIPTQGATWMHISIDTSSYQANSASVTVDDHWLELYQDPALTESTTISVSGFGADEDVIVTVSVSGHSVPDVSGDPLTIKTDASGAGSIRFKPAQNAHTGQAVVQATSSHHMAELRITDPTSWDPERSCSDNTDTNETDDERGGLTIERVIQDQAQADGKAITLRVHYTDENIEVTPGFDPQAILQDFVKAYETQVGSWGFNDFTEADYDADGVAHLYINNGRDSFHLDRGTNAYPDNCRGSQGRNRVINIQANLEAALPNYHIGDFDYIVAHEHFHNLQFAYYGGRTHWGGNGDWYVEGMARFIQTVTNPQDNYVFGSTPSLFYASANKFMENPDRALTSFSYDYCLFWGYLYQHDNGFESLERVLREIRSAGDDPLTDGPEAVSKALSAVGGDHDSMAEAYHDFETAVYLKDFEWENYDWGEHLDDVVEIRDETFTGGDLTIDNDSATDVNTWGLDYIRIHSTTSEDMELLFNGALLGDFTVRFIVYQGSDISVVDLPQNNRELIPQSDSYDRIILTITRTGGMVGNYWVLLRSQETSTDVVLDFDRSGSMGGSKIEAAKDAAKVFVDLLEPPSTWLIFSNDHDRVSLVPFSTSAVLDLSLTSDFDKAKQRIDSYSAGGSTNMGDALSKSISELTDKGRDKSIHSIIYFTDGYTNVGPSREEILNTLVPQAVTNNISIYTFGFGDVDAAFLQQVAAAANGKYYYAPTADQLREVYVEISHAIKGWEQVTNIKGTVAQGETQVAGIIDVEPGATRLKVVLTWPGSDLDLTLKDPSGAAVDPGNTGIIYSGNQALPEFYEIYNPSPGIWTLEVYGKEVDGSENYSIAVFEPGPLMQVKPTSWEITDSVNREMTFTVTEAGGLASLEGVTFTASDLVRADGASIIPASAFSFTPNEFPVLAGEEQDVLATLDASIKSLPGDYMGTITVESKAKTAIISVKLKLTVFPVSIDIWPFTERNGIVLNKDHRIPISILSTETFSATTEVNTTSLTFGKTGDEQTLEFCTDFAVDINEDSLQDLLCIFRSGPTGIKLGDTEGVLKGETVDGTPVEGRDIIVPIPDLAMRHYEAYLNGASEVPAVSTAATAVSKLDFDYKLAQLQFRVDSLSLKGITAIHLHCGSTEENGPVGATLYQGNPITRRTFMGTLLAPDTSNACGWTTLDEVIIAMFSGSTYINVHTQTFPAGEIRGQVASFKSTQPAPWDVAGQTHVLFLPAISRIR